MEMEMGASGKLVDLLRSNLESVQKPPGYQKLRDKLSAIKPSRQLPSVKESPENVSEISQLGIDE
jgi:hypothetical protein